MDSLTFIKLGGAVITHKDIPMSVREEVLARLVREIASVMKQTGKTYIIGNGAGSFEHVPAARYKTKDGFVSPESVLGMAITQDAAARLNRLVVEAFLEQGIPAVTVALSNSAITSSKQPKVLFTDVLREYLEKGLVPVVYGDVIVDEQIGCTIWSTDTIFATLGKFFVSQGVRVDEMFHITEAEGVWKNASKEIYSHITSEMRAEVRSHMVDTKGFDVTGGMWHKIEMSLELAALGIHTRILSGLTKDVVSRALLGDEKIGTTIMR